MSRPLKNWRIAFKYLLAAAAIVFISLLFPNNTKFKFQFELGQTWRYDDLTAPFDFPILKTEEELNTEKAERLRNFSPYYQMDENIADSAAVAFETAFNQQLAEVRKANQFDDVSKKPDRYLNYGKSFLDRLFRRGIVRIESDHLRKGRDFVVNIVRGNTAQPQTIDNLFTVEQARSTISDSLPYAKLSEPEFIFPLIESAVRPNVFYNDTLTGKFRKEQLADISTSRGMVKKGELVIPRDGIVTEEIYQKLVSLKSEYQQEVTGIKSGWMVLLGYILLTTLIIGVFFYYLYSLVPEAFEKLPSLAFILLWPTLFAYLVYLVESSDTLSPYLIPFCVVPIVIKTFFQPRVAFFTYIIVVLVASLLSSLGLEFALLQVIAGMVALLSPIDTKNWSWFFYALVFIFLGYALGYLGWSLIQHGAWDQIEWKVFAWFFLNVFLTLLAYPMIPLVERLFGFVSPITLGELSDLNRPLLRELAIRAPGTLQHSLQVANLAEAAAAKIGADTLLVKTAALYHDIGKMNHPAYFIENQTGKNPHDAITPLESAKVIINHVKDGVQMAKKHGLPEAIIRFILTHHGTTRVEYFYRTHVNQNPDEETDEADFRYPGPRPQSKEETILMLADSIEASCKSLKNPSEEELFQLIDKIIAGKDSAKQLDRSTLTFVELVECTKIFKQIMKSVHHLRIEYPEEKKNGDRAENPNGADEQDANASG